jgi:cell division protein FtsW
MTIIPRTDRSVIGEWWWTIERWLLTLSIVLMLTGVLLALAASPPVARRLDLDSFHFVRRQLVYLLPAFVIMVSASMLPDRQVRRLCLGLLILGFIGMALTLVIGAEVKGAARWLKFGGFSLQPSEFVKPAFVVVCAWAFAEAARRPDVPGNLIAIVLYGLFAGLLVLQPDIGQAMLITLVWGAMFFLAGLSWRWMSVLSGLAVAGAVSAYMLIDHVAKRIDRFLTPGSGDTFQVDAALRAFRAGGWFGLGPGEGKIKAILPDAHSDFIFAVAAEEFGIVICLVLATIFAVIVIRGLRRALHEADRFARLAAGGLVILFGLQAIINLAVNLSLLPAKGMTLPFISYGGSSLLSVALTMGLIIGLTRRRPDKELPDQVWRTEQDAP